MSTKRNACARCRGWFAVGICVVVALAGCGGGSSVTVTGPGGNKGPVVGGQVLMPNGQVAAAASVIERLAQALVARVEALVAGNVEPVGGGVAVTLLQISDQNIVNGQIQGGRVVFRANTDSHGAYAVQLPTGTDPNTCRFVLEVGSSAAHTLTRAFVYAEQVNIDFQSEAVVRLILEQIKAHATTLCSLDANAIASITGAVRNSPNPVVGDNVAALNSAAEVAAAADAGVQDAIAQAIGASTPTPPVTSTASTPAETPTAAPPSATAVPPTATAAPPTATAAPPTATQGARTAVATRTATITPLSSVVPSRTPTSPAPATSTVASTATHVAVTTATNTAAPTGTAVRTNTAVSTATGTPAGTTAATVTSTPTQTTASASTATTTATSTAGASPSQTLAPTATAGPSTTATAGSTNTLAPTATSTGAPPTGTAASTATSTAAATATATPAASASSPASTATATATSSPPVTGTATALLTDTPAPTDTPIGNTPTPTNTSGPNCPMTPGRYIETTTGGSLKVSTFTPFAFPAGGTTLQDVSAPDSNCVSTTVIPYPGGLTVPIFCSLPAFGYSTQVSQSGCGIGVIDSNGGSDLTTVEKGDTSYGLNGCNATQACKGTGQITCGGTGDYVDSSGGIDITVGDGTADTCASGTGNAMVSIPVLTITWAASETGCQGGTNGGMPCTMDAECPGGVCGTACPDPNGFQPDFDTLITQFPQTLDLTTDKSTAQFFDNDADGCDCQGAGPQGPFSNTGTCIDFTAMTVNVAGGGTVFSDAAPLHDLLFTTTQNSTISGPTASGGATCAVPPTIDFTGLAHRCIIAP